MTILSDQKTTAEPDTERAAIIASLRTLAGILADVPELPAMRHEMSWCVSGNDTTGIPAVQQAAAALSEAGYDCELVSTSTSLAVNIRLSGITATAFYVYDQAAADYAARSSYNHVVQVGAEHAEAVSA